MLKKLLILTTDLKLTKEILSLLKNKNINYKICSPSLYQKYCNIDDFTHIIYGTSSINSRYEINIIEQLLQNNKPILFVGLSMNYFLSFIGISSIYNVDNSVKNILNECNSFNYINNKLSCFINKHSFVIDDINNVLFNNYFRMFLNDIPSSIVML